MPYYYGFQCHHKTLTENLVPIEPRPKIDTLAENLVPIEPWPKIDTMDFTAIIKPSPKIWCQSSHGQKLTQWISLPS